MFWRMINAIIERITGKSCDKCRFLCEDEVSCGNYARWEMCNRGIALKGYEPVETKESDVKFCGNTDMAIYILDFIKRGYEKKYQDAGVQKYIEALQMGIDALEKQKGR